MVEENGWVFNNLTYLPSPRSLWEGNPLGNAGVWTDGNWAKWRTECDTADTGRNGCRSYMWGPVVKAIKTASGYSYASKSEWRFNNMVRFS